jgi:PKD repeat protein
LFHYGRYDVDPTSGLNTQSVLGDADSGTWSPDGTITISLATSKLTQVANPDDPPTGNPPTAGAVLSGIHSETRQIVGVLLALIDTTSSGGYTMSGADFCAPNARPAAALAATPTSGVSPLTVAFDASASSDSDAGDSVASYTFRFGDGSTPVTQASPRISHTYADPGSYHASLTAPHAGAQSLTDAVKDITVVTAPTADWPWRQQARPVRRTARS